MLERNVWVAPWLGPSGEPVLLAITSAHRLLLPPDAVPRAQLETRRDFLWRLLDAEDPETRHLRLVES